VTTKNKEEEWNLREDKYLWEVVEVNRREDIAGYVAMLKYGKEGIYKYYAKACRVKKVKPRVTLERDIQMREISLLSEEGIVGRFGYMELGGREIHRWVELTWYLVLGYLPNVFILTKGWFCFVFKSMEELERVLK
jgi:hypothetical protein